MRRISAAVIVAIVLAMSLIPFIPGSSSASEGASVSGYIKLDNALVDDNEMVVTVYCPNDLGTGYDKYVCNGLVKGFFKVEGIPSKAITSCFISFVINAYSVSNWTEYISSIPDSTVSPGTPCYPFTSAMDDSYFISGKDYQIGSETSSIIMTSSFGKVTGRVVTDTSTPVALNGAMISIKDVYDGSVIKRGNTTSGGYFDIECPTGFYNFTVEMSGYQMYSGNVTINDGATTDLREIQLHASDDWLGMDLPHTLAIIGGIIALLLILIGTFFLLRTRRGKMNFISDRK